MKAYNTPKDELLIKSNEAEELVKITPEKTTIANLDTSSMGITSSAEEIDASVKKTQDITLTAEEINALVPVEANPELVGDEADLISLKVDDTKYQIHNMLSYGHSRWKEFLRIYNNGNGIVFCRAGWGTNPESGAQTRIAILNHLKMSGNALIGAEFLYYRSVWPHSDSEQGDEVYVYTLRKNDTWSYEARQAYSKVATGTNLTSTYNDNVLTLDTNAT